MNVGNVDEAAYELASASIPSTNLMEQTGRGSNKLKPKLSKSFGGGKTLSERIQSVLLAHA
jgi:hypothetical protein